MINTGKARTPHDGAAKLRHETHRLTVFGRRSVGLPVRQWLLPTASAGSGALGSGASRSSPPALVMIFRGVPNKHRNSGSLWKKSLRGNGYHNRSSVLPIQPRALDMPWEAVLTAIPSTWGVATRF